MEQKIIAGIILIVVGIFFFLNSRNIGKGAYNFYQKVYTEKNLQIMFKIMGIILIVFGVIIGFVR